MVKYSKLNAAKGDRSANLFAKKFRLDLIEIPEEFKNETLDDIKLRMTRKNHRPFIRTRTSRDIRKYDAWRVFDREILKGGPK